jgi:lipoate-protein ligase A
MQKWRLINSGFQTGAMNMALDEALLHSVAEGNSGPVLRFYRWSPATVTLGYAQSVVDDIDLDVCKTAGLDIVRRSTGGRAVLHDHEVTYSVIAPINSGRFGSSVLDCYRVISEVLLEVLRNLDLPAQLVPGKAKGGQKNSAKAVCFSVPSQYELVVEGRKVAGSAQKRHEQCFLQHGSIPLDIDLDLLGRVLKADVNPETAGALNSVGWLNQMSDVVPSVQELEARIADEFARQLQIEWTHSEPTREECVAAEKWFAEKFSHPEWNYRR